MEKLKFIELRKRISWGSVIAGVVIVMAVSVLLSILGSSIGLFMIDPQDANPASGVGTTIGIWTVVSLVISLGLGGFVAGKMAATDGFIHGVLVWSTTMILTVILVAFLAVGAVKFTANVLGSVSSVAGSVISGVGSAVGSGVSGMADQAKNLFDDIDFDNVDRTEVRQDIRQALRKSGVKEFQPEYLQRQLNGVRSDLRRSARTLAANPSNADQVINSFLERLKTRTDRAFGDVNRDDLVKAISNNSSLSRAEVDRAVDEYIDIYNNARDNAREVVSNLQDNIEQAKADWDTTKQNMREEADKATNAAARSALWSFIALLAGAILCAFAGAFGVKKTMEGYQM